MNGLVIIAQNSTPENLLVAWNGLPVLLAMTVRPGL